MSTSLGSITLVGFPSMLNKTNENLNFLCFLCFSSTEQSEDKYRLGRGLLRDNCPANLYHVTYSSELNHSKINGWVLIDNNLKKFVTFTSGA